MAQFSIPAAPAAYQTVYAGFKGVDLTTDALKISPSRASMALNMISDAGGNPEKRVGWRTLHALDGRINGLHPMEIGGKGFVIIHAGTKLYLYDAEAGQIKDKMAAEQSLPKGYKKVQWIEATGEQYINTGIYANQDTRIVLDFAIKDTSVAPQFMFGARSTDQGGAPYLGILSRGSTTALRSDYGTTQVATTKTPTTSRVIYEQNGPICTIDGATQQAHAAQTFTTLVPVALFASMDGSAAAYYANGTAYGYQAYENGVLVQDGIPCIRERDNAPGFYDVVSGVFRGSDGAKPFTAGPEVPTEEGGYEPRLPDGYQELYSIRSDGRQYADMGFAPDESTRVEFTGSMKPSEDETYLFGARLTRYLDNYSFGCELGVFRTFYGGAEAAFASDVSVTASVDKNKASTTIDASHTLTQDAVTFESPCNLYLGGLNDDGEAVGGADAVWEEVKIYRGDGLYRHLIPCKYGALVGFYDMTNGGMHVSASATPFIAGEEVHGALREGVNDHKSTSFSMNDKLYILTGDGILELSADADGNVTIKDPTVDGYIPTTSISRPMGDAGGGVAFEGVNLLQAQRKNLFFGDGVAKIAQLDVTEIDSVVSVKIDGADVTNYTVDKAKGQVVFTTAPAAPEVNGRDNIEILFSKATEGSADKIRKCTICTTYMDGYAFVSGNPDEPNVDYRCGFDDPTYWPDLGYHKIGNESTPICGYLHVGSRLAIVKAQSVREPAIYFRDMQSGSDGKAVFPVTQGAGGVGAAGQAFANLLGDPMFVSPSGIYGISSSVITSADIVENRSHYVDRELCKHDLSKACMAAWRGYLIAAVNGVAFVLDGNQQKSWRSKDGGSYVYECYHWDNIPAVTMLTIGEALYFGTADGRFCRFNNDIVDSYGDIKMAAYNDDGAAITAVWATLADDDNYIGQYKTMLKRGCSVTIKPFTRSSVEISVQTEKDTGRFIRYQTMDILNWEQLDFERFTFNGIESPQTVALNRKVKKYLTAQIIVKNNAVNEGFGLYKIEKRYTRGGYSKR